MRGRVRREVLSVDQASRVMTRACAQLVKAARVPREPLMRRPRQRLRLSSRRAQVDLDPVSSAHAEPLQAFPSSLAKVQPARPRQTSRRRRILMWQSSRQAMSAAVASRSLASTFFARTRMGASATRTRPSHHRRTRGRLSGRRQLPARFRAQKPLAWTNLVVVSTTVACPLLRPLLAGVERWANLPFSRASGASVADFDCYSTDYERSR